ncbi:MAG: hypothetical protein KGS72_21020 [Cyanobacteria bacterium REEB67]|nr:hypothetical protein [Cyanobacteria bacterium REEB67]
MKIQALVCLAVITCGLPSLPLSAYAFPQTAVRTIVFPVGRSVGLISFVHQNEDGQFIEDADFCQARGLVRVPAARLVALKVNFNGAEDLSFLDKLGPDDLALIDFNNEGRGFEISDRDFVHLGHLTGLQGLNLDDSEAGPQALRAVGKLSKLVMLGLATTLIKDDDLVELEGLKKLRFLQLNYNHLSDAGLAHLQGLLELRRFEARRCGLTGAGMKNLINARHLETLLLSDNKIGDFGLTVLPPLPELTYIDIGGTASGDRTLISLSRDLKLGTIMASYGHYSRTGLSAVAKLPNLSQLSIEGYPIAATDVAALRGALKLKSVILTIEPPAVAAAQKLLPGISLVLKDARKERKQQFIEVLK